jgi:hypothetical protein
MSNCFKFNISGNHNPTNFRNLNYYLMIMFIMTIYYLVINIKHIDIIKSIYPPFFDFIDKFNGCIKNENENENEQKSMSVWYLLYLLVYIVLYAVIIIYIYINIYGLFNTLGDAVFVFVIMMVFLYIIINRIIFYDQCFDPTESESSCFKPNCVEPKSYYDFSSGKCVEESKSEDPPPGPSPTEPSPGPSPPPPPPGTPPSGRDRDGGGRGPPGPPGPPGTPGTNIIKNQTISSFLGTRAKNSKPSGSSNSNRDILVKDKKLVSEVKDDLTGITEGFTLLTNDKKINLKSNLKDTGNDSYKADRLMKVLEEYLKNMNK